MKKVTAARASSLDRVIPCASSALPPPVIVDQDHDLARMGSALHECCVDIVVGDPVDVHAVAAAHRVDVEELGMLVSIARKKWSELSQYMPDPDPEFEFPAAPGLVTHGTADVLSATDAVCAVLDWKSGWSMTEHPYQLIGYAWRARERFGMPDRGYISGFEVWLRFDEWRPYRFTDDDLNAFEARLRSQLGRAGEQYAPGTQCVFCPHHDSCAPFAGWARSGVEILESIDPGTIVTRERVGDVWDRWKAIKAAGAVLEKLADGMLLEGDISLPGGRSLTVRSQDRRSIDPMVALQVLTREFGVGLGDLVLAGGLAVKKTGMDKAVGERAARGMKGKDRERAMETIDADGGVTTTTTRRKVIINNE